MKEETVFVVFLVLMTLYLAGFVLGLRQIFNSEERTLVKGLLILVLSVFIGLLSLVTIFLVAFSTNPWAH